MTPQHAGARRPAYPPKSFKPLAPPTSGNTAAPTLSHPSGHWPRLSQTSGDWPRPPPSVRPLAPPTPGRQVTGPALPRLSGQRGSVQFPTPPSPPATPSLSRSAAGPAHLPAPPRPSQPGGPHFLAGGPCLNLGFASPPRRSCAGAKLPRPRNSRARAERRGCVAAPWPRRRGAACVAAGTAGPATFLSRRCRPYSWTRSTWEQMLSL